MFYLCEVDNEQEMKAADDAAECTWVKLEDIHIEQFGLRSVRQALHIFLAMMNK